MAHYDSKSQRFPIWLRIVLFVAAAVLAIALVVLISACAVINILVIDCVFAPVVLPGAALLFILSLAFLLNTVGNVSDGALDNATGVGIITEVAKRLMDQAPGGMRLRAVATAAEEIGLCGVNAYLDAHRDEIAPAGTVIINFDGCGSDRSVGVLASYGIPAKKVRPDIMAHIKAIAREQSIPLRFSRIPVGMATDCMPFRKAGYTGVDFIGLAGKSHTTRDRIDLIREQALADYVTMGCELSKRLAKEK
jgi:Zn-dependent M28 family amino/carboxypeptidase